MSNKEVRLKIKIDAQSQELILMNQQVKDLGKSFTDTDSFANTFLKRINIAGHLYAGFQVINNTLGDISRTGLEVNKQFQKLTNSLTMASAVMISNNDIYGNAISVQDKYRIAQIEASKATELLQKANIATPHSMKETVQIYDAMYFGMRKVGATTSDMVEITEKLSIAAGNKIGFDAFLSAMDGISTGTVEANSEMGRFLSSIGLSNEAIKNSSDVVQLFKDKLSDFQVIEDYDTKMSNLTNSTDMLSKNLMKIPFDYLESKIPSVASLFDRWAKSINEINIYFTNASNLSTYDELINKQYQLLGKIAEVKNDKFMWDGDQKSQLKELNSELEIVFQKLAKIKQDEDLLKNVVTNVDTSEIDKLIFETLDPYSAKIDEINNKWLSNFNILVKNGKDTTKYVEAWSRALDDVNQKEDDKNKKEDDKNKKALDSLKKIASEQNKAYLDIAKIGMSEYEKSLFSITQQSNEWLKSGLSENEMLYAQGLLIDELNTKRVLDTAKEDLSYQERLLQLKTDSYEKELELINLSYTQKALDIQGLNKPIEDKERLLELETELYNKTLERLQLDTDAQFNNTITTFYQDMLEAQSELNSALYEWGDGIDSIGGKFSNLTKRVTSLANLEDKHNKNKSKLDAKYFKELEKYTDNSASSIEKTKQLEQAWQIDNANLDKQHMINQIDGYASVAGSMAQMFEVGSSGARAFEVVQKSLSIIAGITAIASAMANGDGYTAVARGLAVAATLASFGWSNGGGGGGSAASVPSVADTNQENLDHSNKMITDRLDRQIELLEQLNLQGSAEKLKNISAGIQFDYEQSSARNTIRKKMEENLGAWQGKDQVSIFNSLLPNVTYEGDLVDYFMAKSPVKVWQDYANRTTGGMGAWFSQYMDVSQRQFEEMQNEFQQSIADFTGAVVSSIQTLQSTNDNLKETFDEITESNKYAEIKLKDSFDRVNSLTGALSFSEFLEKEIENIAKLDNELSDKNIALLLSQDIKDMRAQVELVNEISAKTGLVFENGAEDVLNYIDAIEMVSEAMITSRNNIKSFMNSFRSDEQLFNIQASKLGIKTATTPEELFAQFEEMSNDLFGLTNEELEYLESAKAQLEAKNEELLKSQENALQSQIDAYNDQIDNIKSNVSKLENIISSMSSTIEKLRGSVQGSSYTLEQFYKNMDLSLGYSKAKDYENLEKSLKNTISNSSALFEKTNFRSAWDMQFAQMVAANQLESISTDSLTEIDYLRKIEENTKNTVAALTAQLERIGDSLNSSNSALVDKFNELYGDKASQNNINSSIYEIYTKYDLHKFQTDLTGYKYWEDELSNGSVTIKDLEKAIYEAAKENQHIAKSKLNSFAVGTTNVPYDMLAQIHKKEMIVPATFSDGIRAGELSLGDNKEMIKILEEMKAYLQKIDNNIESIDDRDDYKLRVGA